MRRGLLGELEGARRLALPQGAKVLDLGHGYIGHLRLLTTMVYTLVERPR